MYKQHIMKIFLASVALFAFGVAPLPADRQLYVSPKGNELNDGLSWKTAFKTIRQAAEEAKPGDTVTVGGGVYREHVTFEKSGTKEKPVTYRAAENETVVMTWGWDIKGWKKTEGTRFCYEAEFPYTINMLWERKSLNRYLEVNNIELLDKQPGAFMFDTKRGKIFLHAFDGEDPESKGIVAIPYSNGKSPIGKDTDISNTYRWNKGILAKGSYNIFDGFELAFFPVGARLEMNSKGSVIRNCKVYGSCGGILLYGPGTNHLVENNSSIRNYGSGIMIEGTAGDIIIRNNFLLNNGPCPPKKDQKCGTGGHPYNLAQYGGNEFPAGRDIKNVSMTGNMIISDDPLRRFGPVRCKNGIDGNFEFVENLVIGGSTVFYPQPASNAVMKNNTVISGEIKYVKLSKNKMEYKPLVKDNISFKAGEKLNPGFADASFYDYRLRSDSPFKGQGAYPGNSNIIYVGPEKTLEDSGSNPEGALNSLSEALKKVSPGGCIYMLPGKYQEGIKLEKIGEGKKIEIRNYGKGEVIISGSQITLNSSTDITFDGIIFHNSVINLKDCSGMEFTRCVFDGKGSLLNVINSGLLKILNDTFLNEAPGIMPEKTALVFRNNLVCSEKTLPLMSAAGKVISENNVFSPSLLSEWKNRYRETLPSFSADVKISSENGYALPENSALDFAGLGWKPIGAKGSPLKKNDNIIVENLKISTLLPESSVVSWETPFEYPYVELLCKDANNRKVSYTEVHQGEYMKTFNSICVKNLRPASKYKLILTFKRTGAELLKKNIEITTPEKKDFAPKTLFVSAFSGNDENSGISSDMPKKSITAALNSALPGDTIIVGSGEYTEELKIFLNGISKNKHFILKSEKPGKAVINADYILDSGIRISNGKHITIDGFKFTGAGYSASTTTLDLHDCEDIIVRNCIFDKGRKESTTNNQIDGENVTDIEIGNCIFDTGFNGIHFGKSDKVKIFNCTFWHAGITAISINCRKDGECEMYNNIFENVVANHTLAAVCISPLDTKIYCDYNIHWKTKLAPEQAIFRLYADGHENVATIEEARKKYNVEAHGQFADPLLKDPKNGDFSVKAGSPAIGKGRNGANIGADMSAFSK